MKKKRKGKSNKKKKNPLTNLILIVGNEFSQRRRKKHHRLLVCHTKTKNCRRLFICCKKRNDGEGNLSVARKGKRRRVDTGHRKRTPTASQNSRINDSCL